MKTHFKKLRNPNYVGSWDLVDANGNYKPLVATITAVKQEQVFDGKGGSENCMVVHFKECKPMVCNATNAKSITKATGSPYIEDWTGRQVTLTVKQVKAFGEVHDAIRVDSRPPAPAAKPSIKDMDAAIAALKAKTVTLEKILSTYTLSTEQHERLKEAAAV